MGLLTADEAPAGAIGAVQPVPYLGARLASWLLLTAERSDTGRFEITHEFARMVVAPRSTADRPPEACAAREKR